MLIIRRGSRTDPDPPYMRWHNADGMSAKSLAVIDHHGLDVCKVLWWADHYVEKSDLDFNRAPLEDFEHAPLGVPLAKMMAKSPAFGRLRVMYNNALDSFCYGISDAIVDKLLRDGSIVDQAGESVYGMWRPCAEQLEGFNAALFRIASDAVRLHRFMLDHGELDNYRCGRWRKDGDMQDRVSMTVGESNFILDKEAVAVASYDSSALRGWAQPVRYSPYPRNLDASRERFGHEKDGFFAGEGEVHVHTACPVPARDHIKISLLPRCRHGRQDVVERYGDIATVE